MKITRMIAGMPRLPGIATLSLALAGCTAPPHAAPGLWRSDPEPFWQEIPSAGVRLEMVPVPGDERRGLATFWISRTEITWDVFDVFVYGLDESIPLPPGVDAVSRPSRPYLPPDRGFGHEGYAAISLSHRSATEFCRWLSARTGRAYRLAKEDEWERACLGGAVGPYAFGDPTRAQEHAWFAENSGMTPHPVGKKRPNTLGLHDMHGNVAEWVDGRDGRGVIKGGSYRDPLDRLAVTWREPMNPAWNASDPQEPKSTWWLANGPFIGFRVVCEKP